MQTEGSYSVWFGLLRPKMLHSSPTRLRTATLRVRLVTKDTPLISPFRSGLYLGKSILMRVDAGLFPAVSWLYPRRLVCRIQLHKDTKDLLAASVALLGSGRLINPNRCAYSSHLMISTHSIRFQSPVIIPEQPMAKKYPGKGRNRGIKQQSRCCRLTRGCHRRGRRHTERDSRRQRTRSNNTPSHYTPQLVNL